MDIQTNEIKQDDMFEIGDINNFMNNMQTGYVECNKQLLESAKPWYRDMNNQYNKTEHFKLSNNKLYINMIYIVLFIILCITCYLLLKN
jgi:hypothetical protein